MNKLLIASLFASVSIFGYHQDVFTNRGTTPPPPCSQSGESPDLSRDEKHVLKMLSPLYKRIFLYSLDAHQREIVVIYEKRGKSPYGAIDSIILKDRTRSDRKYYMYRSKADLHNGYHGQKAYRVKSKKVYSEIRTAPVNTNARKNTQSSAVQQVYTKTDVAVNKSDTSNTKRVNKYQKSPEFLDDKNDDMNQSNNNSDENLDQSIEVSDQYDERDRNCYEPQKAIKEEQSEEKVQKKDNCQSCKSVYCDRAKNFKKKKSCTKKKVCKPKKKSVCSCCKSMYCKGRCNKKESALSRCKKSMSKKDYKQVGKHKKYKQPKNSCKSCSSCIKCR